MENNVESTCKSCGAEMTGPFCAQCGKPKSWRKMDGGYLMLELAGLFNVEKGLVYTFSSLMTRPGAALREYLTGDRSKFVKPLTFLLATSFFYTVFSKMLKVTPVFDYAKFGENNPFVSIMAWVSSHYGYANVMLGLVMSLWIKLFFRKSPYHYVEILAILCFSLGIEMMLLLGFEGVLYFLPKIPYSLGSLLMFGYGIWSLGDFFRPHAWMNYLKTSLVYALSFISFYFIIIISAVCLHFVRG